MNKKIEKLIEETKQNIQKINEQINDCYEYIKYESESYFIEDNCQSDTDKIDFNINKCEKFLKELQQKKEFYENYLNEKGI